MEIIQCTTDFQLDRETAVAIGKFDGVHIGHRRLLEEILEQRQNGLLACAFTFDPPPAVFLGFSDEKELTTREEKRDIFARMGVDILIEFPMTARTAAIPAGDFVRDVLAGQMQMRFLAAGQDLSFGAGGKGDVKLLQELSEVYSYGARIIDKVCVDGTEVSSTYIRALVERGDMRLADSFLGTPYMIQGEVVRGNRIGSAMGFPTVNLLPPLRKLLPPNGVYYSKVRCGEEYYRAITNVGCKPTVTNEGKMGVESYLYDFDGDLYGQTVTVEFLEFRRPEERFTSLDALKCCLEADVAAGRDFL